MPLDQGIMDAIAKGDLAAISERLTMLLDQVNVHLLEKIRASVQYFGFISSSLRSISRKNPVTTVDIIRK